MPRDSAGVFTLPPTTWATTGQTISVNQHNPAMREIETAITDSLPRNGSAGMTGNLNLAGNRITNLANPVNDGDAVSLGFARNATPIGVIDDYAGDFAPEGWLICDGRSLSRTEYSALFAVIGTKFGSSSSTTFNIPDLRGRVIAGVDNMGGSDARRLSFFGSVARTIGGVFGAASHVLTIGEMPSHNHGGNTGQGGAHSHTVSRLHGTSFGSDFQSSEIVGGNVRNIRIPYNSNTSNAPNHSHTISSQGGGQAHPNAQPTMVMNKIIRAR